MKAGKSSLLVFGASEITQYINKETIKDTLWMPVATFVTGLGMTLMTASVISWMVDRVARSYNARKVANERQEIRDDVFRSIYARFFSEKILHEFDATLFNSEVLKIDTRIEMELTEKEGSEFQGEWLLVQYKHSYKIRNVTSGEIEHPIKLVLELPLRNALKGMCRITRVEIQGEVYSGADLETQNLITSCDDYKTLETKRKLSSGEEITVSFTYQTVKKIEDYELIVMLVPTENIAITAKGFKGLTLKADSNNSKRLTCRKYNDYDCEWQLNNGMLPFQSIAVWWKTSEIEQSSSEVDGC
ncbi:hypothetical protein J6I75_08725 [Pseudidiomarina sp. 1APP75-27a]|uniref:hypothetical protein n=1 Tax=Pseudidiomarina terrestris TaxID=2820060 RepID=UPI002B053B45|nr:hypothetical protein [Pseudidiomarina sp. 1APP75-27a]MEA3588435.1 hypothetical protein [Pseudidiomarina sp. 1APP75-27a]